MIDDIFKVFGEQTGEILFEIIKDCMDDYLYILICRIIPLRFHSQLWNGLICRKMF